MKTETGWKKESNYLEINLECLERNIAISILPYQGHKIKQLIIKIYLLLTPCQNGRKNVTLPNHDPEVMISEN